MSERDETKPRIETEEPLMRFFKCESFDDKFLVERRFGQLAQFLVENLPRNAERTVALRKLLEGKDAAVRAKVP